MDKQCHILWWITLILVTHLLIIWRGGDPRLSQCLGWFSHGWDMIITVQISLHVILLSEKEENFHQLRMMLEKIMMVHHCTVISYKWCLWGAWPSMASLRHESSALSISLTCRLKIWNCTSVYILITTISC